LNGGVSRVTTTGTNKAVHFDGTGYIQTPSFAIPNAGILAVEV
jgi:hypothetical protein